jgi:acid phosphatase type 7
MNPAGQSDPQHGIPQIIVGTGGEALDTLAKESNGAYSNPNVVTAQDQAFGVMKLTLGPDSYSWDYKPALAGPGASATAMSYSDSGTANCRG